MKAFLIERCKACKRLFCYWYENYRWDKHSCKHVDNEEISSNINETT